MDTKSLINIDDININELSMLIKVAQRLKAKDFDYNELLKHRIMASLFFEPSTRTYFSFVSAMYRLGGTVLGFPQAAATSIAKGESIEDTVRMMAAYADLLVIRHPEIGICKQLAKLVEIPIINAGEGTGEHPTQTLTDLFTIYEHFQNYKITIALYGDLKYGRTNHSLLLAGARLGINFICIAPEELQMPEEYIKKAKQLGAKVKFTSTINDYIKEIDVLYVTRLQKERFPAHMNYERFKHSFAVGSVLAQQLKANSIIMHPLPRVNEIEEAVDYDSRAKYFLQAANAVPMRMAIILFCFPHLWGQVLEN